MMRKVCLLQLLVLLVVLSSSAFGTPQPDNSASSPEPQREQKTTETSANQEVTDLKKKIIETQNNSKLGFNKIITCKSVECFGSYAPLESTKSPNKLVFYVEPSNFSTLISSDRYIIDCT